MATARGTSKETKAKTNDTSLQNIDRYKCRYKGRPQKKQVQRQIFRQCTMYISNVIKLQTYGDR